MTEFLRTTTLSLGSSIFTVPIMPPVSETILPGSAVGMAVSKATSRAFPKAAPHSSLNEYLWIKTAAMPSTKATGILAAQPMLAVATSSPKSITSIAQNPNPTSGCNPTAWQNDLSEPLLPMFCL